MPETRSRSSTNIITNEELDLMITEAVEAALQKTKEFFLKKIAEMQKVYM
jgi:D-aminopeptidase